MLSSGQSPSVGPAHAEDRGSPRTPKVDVADDYHGQQVPDPYRWLEDGDSPAVNAWDDSQNARAQAVIAAYPARRLLHERLTALIQMGALSGPAVRVTKDGGRRYFHMRRQGGQNQRVLYVRDGLHGVDRPLIDVTALASDGSASLDWSVPAPNGALVAWGRSDGGTEDSTLYVRNVDTGADLADRIPHTRLASIAWLPDARSFFYTRHPTPGTVPAGDERYHRRVFLHEIGDDPAQDQRVFPDPWDGRIHDKTHAPSVALSPSGQWLVVRVHQGPDRSKVYFRDRWAGEYTPWVDPVGEMDGLFEPIARDDALYLVTNHQARRARLVRVDYRHHEATAWRDVIPERPDVLRAATIAGGTIIARYIHEGAARLERFTLDGCPLGSLAIPEAGSASVHAAHDGDEAFVHFTSFAVPGEVIRFDLATGAGTVWDSVGGGFGSAGVRVERLHTTSKDGTRIPMFMVQREDAARDGSAPAILTGYGGFNLCVSLAFNPFAAAAIEGGAAWVVAVLRGGGEFGDEWHRAGMQANKQNVFDDFIACAEELQRSGITSRSRLAVMGSSNGGLLTAAVVTQRPDLFRAALVDVPLTDMLRFQHFRIGRFWVPEYGSADDPDQFHVLRAYSPLHNVHDGTVYPSTLFTTADSDARVDPMHARKMAARMQEAQPRSVENDRPILIRIERGAGHGAGKSMEKLADEFADELAFLFQALGVP